MQCPILLTEIGILQPLLACATPHRAALPRQHPPPAQVEPIRQQKDPFWVLIRICLPLAPKP